jgi:hypothetical protein
VLLDLGAASGGHRDQGAGGVARRQREGEPTAFDLELQKGLPKEIFKYLTDGLQPAWRVRGSVLCKRGDYADRVFLVERGDVYLDSEHKEPRLDATWRQTVREPNPEKDQTVLGQYHAVGFWAALLPLDDPFVSGGQAKPRPDAEDEQPAPPAFSGVEDGDRRRGPQPHRCDVTVVVGRHNASIFELDREEFLRRLDAMPKAMFHVCLEVARGLVLAARRRWRTLEEQREEAEAENKEPENEELEKEPATG